MARSNTDSSKFDGQVAPRHESTTCGSTFGAATTPGRDENQANRHDSRSSDRNSTGWGKLLLNLAQALGAQPAA
jgi:hypothetical protein